MKQDDAVYNRDEMRRYVLDALDTWARARFGHTEFVRGLAGAGWQDQDLPNLFPALDRHFETCIARFGVTVEGDRNDA